MKIEKKTADHTHKKEDSSKVKKIIIIAFVAIIVSLAVSYYIFPTISPVNIKEIYTRQGETLKHSLPDGSLVWLNENTRISFPENFGNSRREMHLVGEAYFEIENERWRPFLIHASNAVIEVLGTSFNLKTNMEEDSLELIAVSGRLSLYSERNPSEEVIIEPGKAGFYFRKTDAVLVRENLKEDFLAWQKNKLVFSNTPIHEVVNILKSRFNAEIDIASLEIINCTITNTFEAGTLQEILDSLALSTNIYYSKKGDTFILLGTQCDVEDQ